MVQNRHLGLDLLRILSAFGVILIHVSAPYVTKNMKLDNSLFWAGNLYDTLGRFSVPIFVVISGYFLVKPVDDLQSFYRKRFIRILFPFICWSAIYILWAIFFDMAKPKKIIDGLLWGKPYFHLWFLGMLMGLYAITPILGDFLKRIGRKNFTYVALGALLLGMGIESWNTYMHNRPWIGVWWLPYVGYFMIGSVVAYVPKNFHNKWLLVGALICSYSAVFIFTGLLFKEKHYIWYFYDSLGICGIIATLSYFNLFRQLNIKHSKLIQKLASLSFGIYLFHMIPLTVINRYFITEFPSNPFAAIPLVAGFVFVVSSIVVAVIALVPIMRKGLL